MKQLTRDEMKKLIGGVGETCTAKCNCSGGAEVSCTGTTCEVCWDQNHILCTGVDCGTGGSASCKS
jgi:hypothetical protein